MSQIVNTNISSANAQRYLSMNQHSLTSAMQRLSSGLRINSASDDAAGLAISERFTTQIRGNDQAVRNANDGISITQTAEGDLQSIGKNLQRMRELAVQSANASNTDSDRKAIDGELQSLSQEIDRVSQNSSFNGTKLLDGSFTAKNFQIGSNTSVNDTIQVTSITSTRTSALGSSGATFAATLQGGKTTTALAAGDLTLNGQQVGASSIGSLPGQSTASAYSIAQAINKVTQDSGVTATADTNTVTGGAATVWTAINADTFSINGINIGAVAAGVTAAGQGANVAAAINLKSTQTGVTATANASSGALTLTASEGRDISIGLVGSATGVSAGAQTTAAALTKSTLVTQTGILAANIGVQGTAGITAVAATTGALGAFTAGGAETGGTAGYDTTITLTGTIATTPLVITDAVAASGTGDFSTMATALTTAGFTANGSTVNGYTISYGASADAATALSAGTLSFSRADGDNFTTAVATAGTGTATGTPAFASATSPTTTGVIAVAKTVGTDTANHGTVSLSSTSANGIIYGGAAATSAGFSASGTVTAATTSSVTSIASINVLTATNATKALDAIDGALNTINSARASLGAYQNRFASIVDGLQVTTENLTASRSRITDADFAKESANLSRAQVLQQAGTAMLAQANQSAQGVLALLR